MYEETKIAIKKAFEIGRELFLMGAQKYTELLAATSRVRPPTIQETNVYVEDGMSLEEAIIEILRERYIQAAQDAGFTEDQGLAMLEYAAMLEEMNDE